MKYIYKKFLSFSMLVVMLFGCSYFEAWANEPMAIYVSTQGSDENGGMSINNSVLSLHRAVEIYKSYSAQKIYPVIYLRGGKYHISKSIVLDDNCANMVIRPYNNETVSINGSVSLDKDRFRALSTADEMWGRIPQQVRERLYVYDLSDSILTDMEQNRGFAWIGRENTLQPYELYLDGELKTVARWPDAGWAYTGFVETDSTDTFEFGSDKINNWVNADEALFGGYWGYKWVYEEFNAKSIDVANKKITFSQDTSRGLRSNQEFFVYNLPEELDSKGEYFVDTGKKKLYVYEEREKLQNAELSVMSDDIFRIENTQNIIIENIKIGYARKDAVTIASGDNIRINGCTISNVRNGVVCDANTKNSSICSSDIYSVGFHGVSLHGGTQLTLERGNNTVENCDIYNFDRTIRTYGAGVCLIGVGNSVKNCNIHDGPHSAVIMTGNNHLVESNKIYNIGSMSCDGGAIYYFGKTWIDRGNVIRYNYFDGVNSSVRNPDTADLWCIYADNLESGLKIYGNIFANSNRPVSIGGGRDVEFTDNIVFNNTGGAEYVERGTAGGLWTERVKIGGEYYTILKNFVNQSGYDREKWYSAYDTFESVVEDVLDPQKNEANAGHAKGAKVTRNLFAAPNAENANYNRIFDDISSHGEYSNNAFSSDLGDIFTNASNGDFTLSDKFPFHYLSRTFENIDFSRMGVYVDSYRTKLPRVVVNSMELHQQDGNGFFEDFSSYQEKTAVNDAFKAESSSRSHSFSATVQKDYLGQKALRLTTDAIKNENATLSLKFNPVSVRDCQRVYLRYSVYAENHNRVLNTLMGVVGYDEENPQNMKCFSREFSAPLNGIRTYGVSGTQSESLVTDKSFKDRYVTFEKVLDYNISEIRLYRVEGDEKIQIYKETGVAIPDYVDELKFVVYTDERYIYPNSGSFVNSDMGIYWIDDIIVSDVEIGAEPMRVVGESYDEAKNVLSVVFSGEVDLESVKNALSITCDDKEYTSYTVKQADKKTIEISQFGYGKEYSITVDDSVNSDISYLGKCEKGYRYNYSLCIAAFSSVKTYSDDFEGQGTIFKIINRSEDLIGSVEQDSNENKAIRLKVTTGKSDRSAGVGIQLPKGIDWHNNCFEISFAFKEDVYEYSTEHSVNGRNIVSGPSLRDNEAERSLNLAYGKDQLYFPLQTGTGIKQLTNAQRVAAAGRYTYFKYEFGIDKCITFYKKESKTADWISLGKYTVNSGDSILECNNFSEIFFGINTYENALSPAGTELYYWVDDLSVKIESVPVAQNCTYEKTGNISLYCPVNSECVTKDNIGIEVLNDGEYTSISKDEYTVRLLDNGMNIEYILDKKYNRRSIRVTVSGMSAYGSDAAYEQPVRFVLDVPDERDYEPLEKTRLLNGNVGFSGFIKLLKPNCVDPRVFVAAYDRDILKAAVIYNKYVISDQYMSLPNEVEIPEGNIKVFVFDNTESITPIAEVN